MAIETENAYTTNIKVQVLEGIVLSAGDAEKTSRVNVNHSTAGCRLVRGEGIYRTLIRSRALAALEMRTGGNVNEGGAGINDTSSRRQDRLGAVSDALIDTPEGG